MALVTVTPPKPPGSSASISPPAAVFEIAPGKVLHGAVRLQGLASSPTPEIQVGVDCAYASCGQIQTSAANKPNVHVILRMSIPPVISLFRDFSKGACDLSVSVQKGCMFLFISTEWCSFHSRPLDIIIVTQPSGWLMA